MKLSEQFYYPTNYEINTFLSTLGIWKLKYFFVLYTWIYYFEWYFNVICAIKYIIIVNGDML